MKHIDTVTRETLHKFDKSLEFFIKQPLFSKICNNIFRIMDEAMDDYMSTILENTY